MGSEINVEIDVDAEFERFVCSPHGLPEAFSLLNEGDAASAFKLCFAHGCVVGAKIVKEAAAETRPEPDSAESGGRAGGTPPAIAEQTNHTHRPEAGATEDRPEAGATDDGKGC